jgi:tetratricopeptide (TPR) repeat protein
VRRLLAGTLIPALLGAGASVSPADEPLVRWNEFAVRLGQPIPPPFALAALYASGRRAEAIAKLEGWGESEMKEQLVSLRSLNHKMGGRLPEAPLLAAVMLHTDRDLYERLQAPVVESVRVCGIDRHAGYARALVGLLVVQSDQGRESARRWLTAMALSSHWDLCLDDVRRWTHEGLKWFPKDAQLLLIQATAAEESAALTPVPAVFANPANRSEGLSDLARRRQDLVEARRDLEAALALDPELHEARLRLGRVLWRLEKPQEARPVLQDLLQRKPDPWERYLGHLFLGRVLQDTGDRPGAIEQYRSALAIDPDAQAAAVALSEALLLSGRPAEAREILGRAVQATPRGQPRDAYMSYHLGRSNAAESMLEALRAETLE